MCWAPASPRARLLLPWGQKGNRGTELQYRASSGAESFTEKLSCLITSLCVCVCVRFSQIAGFIWMYSRGGAAKPNDALCSFRIHSTCISSLSTDNLRKRNTTCKCATKLWKWSDCNDKPSRLKRRWVAILYFSLLSLEDHCNYVPYISPFSALELLKLSSLRKWLISPLYITFTPGMCAPRGVHEELDSIVHSSGELLSSPAVRL